MRTGGSRWTEPRHYQQKVADAAATSRGRAGSTRVTLLPLTPADLN
jgi:hypothetical protein